MFKNTPKKRRRSKEEKMSQAEVYSFLKRNFPKWINTAEIRKNLNITNVHANLYKLWKYGEIERRWGRMPGNIRIIEWRYKK